MRDFVGDATIVGSEESNESGNATSVAGINGVGIASTGGNGFAEDLDDDTTPLDVDLPLDTGRDQRVRDAQRAFERSYFGERFLTLPRPFQDHLLQELLEDIGQSLRAMRVAEAFAAYRAGERQDFTPPVNPFAAYRAGERQSYEVDAPAVPDIPTSDPEGQGANAVSSTGDAPGTTGDY